MIQCKNAFLIVGVILLQACASPSPSQMKAPNGKSADVSGWRAYDPNQNVPSGGACPFCWANYDLRANQSNQNLYWARLQKSESGFVVVELSPTPLQRTALSEEILALDTRRKLAEPAFSTRANQTDVVSSTLCEKQETEKVLPYTVCNSAFAGLAASSVAARVILGVMTLGTTEINVGNRIRRDYLPDVLAGALDGQALERLVPAAAEKRRLARLDTDRIATEKRIAQQEAAARAFEQKRAADSAKVKSLTSLPKGYKDVCTYEPRGVSFVYYDDQAETYELVCANSGSVPGLAKLKEAGFIITNISERTEGSRASRRFNVEKIR